MGGGGAIVDSFRHWCRQRWSKINSPCVASDAIAPETLQRSVSSSSSHPSTNHSHSHSHTHGKDLLPFHNQNPHPPHHLPPPPPPSLPHRLPSPLSVDPALLSLDTELHKDPTKAPPPPPPSSKHRNGEKSDGKSHLDPLHCKVPLRTEFFTEYGESNRYALQEVIGKGSYGVVCSAIDRYTGERVAIKKINDIFEHVSDAMRILREIKLLRLLRHPDIVEVKHITLPLSRRGFKDIYVVFELMESDLHQVIKANDDLTPEHHQFFLYQLLRAMKYIHTANVYHRDLKPKNILANADCKLKICDFGLARVAFNDAPTAIFWTDYVATRWYRAPELCGSFFSKYTPAVDIWSVGCIFAEVLSGKPLFPGKNVVHQLDLITDLLGSPSPEAISRIRNDKARCYLSSMCKKISMPLDQKFPNADPLALQLLKRLLAFDPRDRPTAEEAMGDPYFKNLANKDREPSAQPITKAEFDFERRKMSKEDVRELIYREILEYHPKVLKEYMSGKDRGSLVYPSGVDNFKRQFSYLEDHYSKNLTMEPRARKLVSPPRDSALDLAEPGKNGKSIERDKNERASTFFIKASSKSSHKASQGEARLTEAKEGSFPKKLLKSASVSGSLSSTSSAFGDTKRSAASKHESGSRKKESLDSSESKHKFLGFEFTRKVQALSSSLAYR